MADEPPAGPGPKPGDEVAKAEPAPGSIAARLADTRRRAIEALEAARGRSRVVDAVSTVAFRPRIVAQTILASYLAMRLFVLLFPLAYVIVAGLGLYSHQTAEGPAELASDVGLAPALSASISEAATASSRGHWFALIVGIWGVLWAARGVLRALRGMLALTWGLPAPKSGLAPLGPALVAVGITALVLMSSLFDKLRADGVAWWLVALLGLIVEGSLWLAASVHLPHKPCNWWDLLPGAVLFSLGLQGLNLATTLYFGPRASTAEAAYGVLGIGLVLISWLVVLGWVVLLSAELNAGLYEWRQRSGAVPPSELS